MIDIHCHILPGLDDGAQDLEEAVGMARIAHNDGIEKIVATPHLFRDNFTPENLSVIREKKEELSRVLKDKGIPVDICTGAEVHISHNLIEEIREHREHLTLNGSSYMFVEFPSDHVFSGVKDLFFELMTMGISPVIAHPERNRIFMQSPALLYDLIEMGGLAQANSGSFFGHYGGRVEAAAFRFLELNLVHFIGSDGHNTRSKGPRLSKAAERAAEVIGEKNARALVLENPKAVLEDNDLSYHPNPVNPEEKMRKLKIRLPGWFKR